MRDGVVGLQGALGKGAAVPLPFVGGALARNVRNSDQLSFEIAAAVVSGLAQVTHPLPLIHVSSPLHPPCFCLIGTRYPGMVRYVLSTGCVLTQEIQCRSPEDHSSGDSDSK